MTHELKLGFYMKRASLVIDDLDELNPDGKRLLQLISEGYEDTEAFQKACSLLKENISALYITGNADELMEIFESDDETEADDIEIVKLSRPQDNEIMLTLQGRFTVPVTRPITNDEILNQIAEEFEGDFANGLMVQVPIFEENLDDPFAEVNGGEGDTLTYIESYNVYVIEDESNE